MIMIETFAKPDYLRSTRVINARRRIKYRIGAKIAAAIKSAEEQTWRDDKLTDALYDSHHAKCCYCERKRDRKYEMDVEHYRPKGGIYGVAGHKGYWWLVYTWNNLLWSCRACNQRYKKTHFTVLAGSTRATDDKSDLGLEKSCLINPKLEDPSQFLSFHIDTGGGRHFITVVPRGGQDDNGKERANETIRIVGLNREEGETKYNLVKERGDEFAASAFTGIVISILAAEEAKDRDPARRQNYIDAIHGLRMNLKKYIRQGKVFSGMYRDYLRRSGIEYESLL